MAEAGRGYPDADTFVTPARIRLAAAARALVDAVLTENANDEQIDAATVATEGVVQGLREANETAVAAAIHTISPRRRDDYLPRSPLFGTVNPVAPPFDYEFIDGRLVGRGVFGAACEGPPGYVHGGWVALAFDEALGFANVAGGRGGMTARLTIRYRKPTPLYTELTLEAASRAVDTRRTITTGHLRVGDIVVAEAEGLFVSIGRERSLEYFGEA